MDTQKFSAFQWRWSIFVALGISMIAMGSSAYGISTIFDYAAMGFTLCGAVMVMVGLIYSLPSSNFLEVDAQGFSYRDGLKTEHCRWEDCSEFSTWSQKIFGMATTELVTFDSKTPSNSAKTNEKTTGKNGVFPGTYGLEPDELAQKLNQLRAQYSQAHSSHAQIKPMTMVVAS